MPFNLLKQYFDLLEIGHFTVSQRHTSLMGVFARDIQNNPGFKFRGKQIKPIKKEGQVPLQILFHHLTTREDKDEKGKNLGTRSFEMARSLRLHWIKHHIEENEKSNVEIFSYEDRVDGKSKIRTYVYDLRQQYVVILELQRSGIDYYLLTAYHLNDPGGRKQIEKKLKKKLPDVH